MAAVLPEKGGWTWQLQLVPHEKLLTWVKTNFTHEEDTLTFETVLQGDTNQIAEIYEDF